MFKLGLPRGALVKAAAVKGSVGAGLVLAPGAAPAAQGDLWTNALWVGGAILGILLFVFILSRSIKPGKDDDSVV